MLQNARTTQIIFVLLFIAVMLTIIRQIIPSDNSHSSIDPKTYIALPDRKPLPVVILKQAGKGAISTESMKGKWHLLVFGYTFCPDVCPLELTALHQMMDILRTELSPEQLPQIVFISIDPQRDTPEIAAQFAAYFDKGFIGLTGDQSDLKTLTIPYGITWMKQQATDSTTVSDNDSVKKQPYNNNKYLISHTTTIILVNPEVKVTGLFPAPHLAREMARIYQQVIQKEVFK